MKIEERIGVYGLVSPDLVMQADNMAMANQITTVNFCKKLSEVDIFRNPCYNRGYGDQNG